MLLCRTKKVTHACLACSVGSGATFAIHPTGQCLAEHVRDPTLHDACVPRPRTPKKPAQVPEDSSASRSSRGAQTPPPSARAHRAAHSRPGSSASHMDTDCSGEDSPDEDYHPDASEESPEDDYQGDSD